jgi:hypothetical protein
MNRKNGQKTLHISRGSSCWLDWLNFGKRGKQS